MTKFFAAVAATLAAGALAIGAAASDGNYRGNAAPAGTTTVHIRHVMHGCHVWSKSGIKTTYLRLTVKRGSSVKIVNRDVKAHELVELAGPSLALEGHMMAGKTQVVMLMRPGVYRFKTRIVEMGPPVDVETMGPDNILRLKVTVR